MEQQVQELQRLLQEQQDINQQQLLEAQQKERDVQQQLQTAQNNSFHQGYRKRKQEETDFKEGVYRSAFQDLRMELRAQGAANNIRNFSGESSDKYVAWLKDMERVLTQLQGDDSRAHALALQTLNGPAADFVTRLLKENPHMTWASLKKSLGDRYSDMADLAYARQKLRRLVQAKNESVENFHERLLTAAETVYGPEKLRLEYIQDQLIEYFIDGLTEDAMAKRLIRLKPKSMEDALKHATAEQQAQKTFDLRRGHASETEHTPMEVDAITSTPQYSDEFAKISALLQEVLVQLKSQNNNKSVPNGLQPRDPRGRFTGNNGYVGNGSQQGIECYRCHRRGHIAAHCRTPPRRNYQNYGRSGAAQHQQQGGRTYADVAAQPPRNEYYGQSGNM